MGELVNSEVAANGIREEVAVANVGPARREVSSRLAVAGSEKDGVAGVGPGEAVS